MLGVTPEMAFFFYSFFKLPIFCRLDEKFDGVCQQLHSDLKYQTVKVLYKEDDVVYGVFALSLIHI